MTTIQQWRRGIQPTRSRTPYAPLETEEWDDYFSVTTPKRRLKPKLSSYFNHNQKLSVQEGIAPITAELPSWPLEQLYPDPKAEEMMDSVMCRIMADPYAPLDVRHNSSLMSIFEEYLKLRDEKRQVHQQLQEEMATVRSLISKFDTAETNWLEDLRDYKEEVKRLEVLLARASKRGVAEVTLARQDSKLRNRKAQVDGGRNTTLEFLEKTRHSEETAQSGQRATMEPKILQSPSGNDKRLSLRLSQKKPSTKFHAALPDGTPPLDTRFSLAEASALEQQAKRHRRNRAATSSTITTSDDTFSTFSCVGDLLPDETTTPGPSRSNDIDDFSSIEQIANAIARRRHVDPAVVLPQLLDLFGAGPEAGSRASSMPLTSNAASPRLLRPTRWPERNSSKQKTVISKASGFFHRLKPQLAVDTVAPSSPAPPHPAPPRRFSFEPEDDLKTAHDERRHDLPQAVKDRILKKSASLAALNEQAARMATTVDRAGSPALQRPLSPVAQSPPVSAPESSTLPSSEGRLPSRIPTPVFNSIARPRQEREDSASSLLTAIKLSSSHRSNSMTSSIFNSPPAGQVDFVKASQPATAGSASLAALTASSSSKSLQEYTNTLRAGPSVAAASRAASTSSEMNSDVKGHVQRTSARSQTQCSSSADMSDPRQENIRPID